MATEMARSVVVGGVGLGAPMGRPRMTARATTRYLAPREPAEVVPLAAIWM